MLMLRRLKTWLTKQTIYSTLLDAIRLKVPELIRRFDDNLRPKTSNYSIVLWTLLHPKASNLRRIQYDSELKRPKASKKRRIYRFGIKASKSVEKVPINSQKRPKASINCLLGRSQITQQK